jgi:hypothetical protein
MGRASRSWARGPRTRKASHVAAEHEEGVQMTTGKLAAVVLSFGISLMVTSCGTSGSSHAVQKTKPPVTAAPTSTTSTTSASTSSSTLNTQIVNQVGAQLGGLDNNLNTANSDLNSPRGDS